jgi:GNAT superfamily N-acetyltransferase
MILLPFYKIHLIRGLFKGSFPNSSLLFGYLDGKILGIAYVDNIDDPRFSIVITGFSNWTFIGGFEAIRDINSVLKEFTNQGPLHIVWPSITPTPLKLKIKSQEIRNTFKSFNIDKYQKSSIRLGSCQLIIEELTNKNISKSFFKNRYETIYGSIDKFLQNSFGYILLYESRTIGEISALLMSNKSAEIQIDVVNEYRKQGYASILLRHFIDRCLSLGFTPCWSCETSNLASNNLAEKIGFEEKQLYSILTI